MSTMAAAAEAEMLQPWRRSFPLCRPYSAHSKEDAARFLREFAEGADSIDVDADWTMGDVFRGVHEGGNAATAPPINGTVPQQARKTRSRDKRRAKLASELLKYVLVDGVREMMRGAAQNGEQMLVLLNACLLT